MRLKRFVLLLVSGAGSGAVILFLVRADWLSAARALCGAVLALIILLLL